MKFVWLKRIKEVFKATEPIRIYRNPNEYEYDVGTIILPVNDKVKNPFLKEEKRKK